MVLALASQPVAPLDVASISLAPAVASAAWLSTARATQALEVLTAEVAASDLLSDSMRGTRNANMKRCSAK